MKNTSRCNGVALQSSADARQQLNTILSMPVDPNYLPELREAQTQARQMLEQIKEIIE